VLYFSNSLVRGGAEEHMLTLLRGLDRRFFRPHLTCTPELAKMLRAEIPTDVEVFPLCLRKPGQLAAALRLRHILHEREVGILHSHLFFSSAFASPIGWACRVPVIMETPHVRERWRRGAVKGRFFVDRFVGRFVDYYIAVSTANRRYLIEEKGLPEEKVYVIYNGCDLGKFAHQCSTPQALKASLNIGDSDPVLMVVGRLEPQKGHRVLLEALPQLRCEFPKIRLICLGEGDLRADLEKQARDLGLERCAHFVGYQSNVPSWLMQGDVVVLPSFYEGLPLAAIEALAAGRAVVATAVDGTPEVVLNGKTGLTVPPGDVRLLAEAISRLLRDPILRQSLGAAGRTWVTERFNQNRQIRQTERLYLYAWQNATKAELRCAVTRREAGREGMRFPKPATSDLNTQ